MKREVTMCDHDTYDVCQQVATCVCPICERDFCSGHFIGTITTIVTVTRAYGDGKPLIDVSGSAGFCTQCLDAILKISEEPNSFAWDQIVSYLPETLVKLRTMVATAALMK